MLGEFARRQGFWLLDFLKGSPIRKRVSQLNEIKKNQNNLDALDVLLKHAVKTVPYYKGIEKSELSCFPVVSKKDYIKDFEAFRSSEFLNDDELHKVYTSGSTGTPFMAFQDRGKVQWHQAGLINLNNSIGWKLGDKFLFFRVWGISHGSSKLQLFMTNTVPVNVIDFNDEKKEDIRCRLLKDHNLHLMLGYASAIESLSDYLSKYKEDYGIRLVVSDSENLSNTAKNTIREVFNCEVLNRYANNENGILAISMTTDDPRMYVNYPEYYVEILDFNSDTPVEVGKPGRIVITDLYNKAFPFIRYDTGDIAVADKMSGGGQCTVIRELMGRVSNSLRDTNGNVLSETTVVAFFENIVGIKRHQIAQLSKNQYEIRIENRDNKIDELLIEHGKSLFGKDAEVTVLHVERIQQGKNGKYKITSYEVV